MTTGPTNGEEDFPGEDDTIPERTPEAPEHEVVNLPIPDGMLSDGDIPMWAAYVVCVMDADGDTCVRRHVVGTVAVNDLCAALEDVAFDARMSQYLARTQPPEGG